MAHKSSHVRCARVISGNMAKCKSLGILLCLTYFAISWTPTVTGERILFVYPLSSKSMANLFEPLAKGLLDRGHEVTIIGPVPLKMQSSNLTEVIPIPPGEFMRDYPNPFEVRKQSKLFSFPVPLLERFCHRLYKDKKFTDIFNEKFDLVFLNIIHHDCFAGLLHQMGSPIILFATLPVASPFLELYAGNHQPYSFLPICVFGDIAAEMSFVQRTKNFLYNFHFMYILRWATHRPMERVYREHLGHHVPGVADIYRKQVGIILMNSHPVVTLSRPLLPEVVEIGGIHCRPPKALPKDLEDFASGAKHGFIVFSLGSIVQPSNMPESVRKAFVQTFSKLEQKVIWKWDKDEGMPDLPPNVKLVKWLPQQDLLGHPNMKLFITHGGLLSTEEAVYHGVPVIGMPVFIDQDANMKQAEILGFGLKGEILDLTEDKLTPLVRKILDDPSYMARAKELSTFFRDQPQPALEKAVFWSEYVMRHKGAHHLKSSGMNLNMIQYHSIDVIALLLAVTISFIFILYLVMKQVIRRAVIPLLCKLGLKSKAQVNRKKKHA